jgi:transposase
LFQTLQFFDPRDLLQVKYEMVRRVLTDGWSVSRSAAAFGFSRISYYRIQHAFQILGLPGLMPQKRGPTHPNKITEAVQVFLRQRLEQQPALSAAKLKVLLAGELGVQVHIRTIERALRKKNRPDPNPRCVGGNLDQAYEGLRMKVLAAADRDADRRELLVPVDPMYSLDHSLLG